jgi:hypothetical protein
MLILSKRFLQITPSHVSLALTVGFAFWIGFWSIPTTVHYAASAPCQIVNISAFSTPVNVIDCQGCVETPPVWQSAPTCASVPYYLTPTPQDPDPNQPPDPPPPVFCRKGFKCCFTCCDICTSCSRGECTSFPCNCSCCETVDDVLCSISQQTVSTPVCTLLLTDNEAASSEETTVVVAGCPPPALRPPLNEPARCKFLPATDASGPAGTDTPPPSGLPPTDVTFLPSAFPSEVWVVPCAVMGTAAMANVGWWYLRRRAVRLKRAPTIFSAAPSTGKPPLPSSLSVALFEIRQGARMEAPPASSS